VDTELQKEKKLCRRGLKTEPLKMTFHKEVNMKGSHYKESWKGKINPRKTFQHRTSSLKKAFHYTI
jgi:hypothetical protein